MEPITAIFLPIVFGFYFYYYLFSDCIFPVYEDVLSDPSPPPSSPKRPSVAIVKNNISEREFFLDETTDESSGQNNQ